MKKKPMTLEQHRLLREVKQLMTNAGGNGNHAKAKMGTDAGHPVLLT